MHLQSRRTFLKSVAGLSAVASFATFNQLSAAERGKVKITDIKTMVLQGPRTYTFVRIDTDAGVSGWAEAYGSPGIGIKEAVHVIKKQFIGQDPLQIGRLYTQYDYTDGSAHQQQRAMSGIDMAMWDLAGKLLNVPTYKLLGGRYRDKVRIYDHATPRNFFDKAVLKDWAAEVKAKPQGINCHKFAPLRSNENANDPGHDGAHRVLSTLELRKIRQGFENCREALGWEHDIMIGCHWEFDVRTSVDFAEALRDVKPVFLEDPMPVNYSESWKRLVEMSAVPICTGENWMRREEAMPFIVNSAVDILHLDLRNVGGFTESKRLADLGELYAMPVANHNTGSIVNGLATTHWASTIRDYVACETVFFNGTWMDDVVLHDKPLCTGGMVPVSDKPGLGIELNPDVVKAHLAQGESWWG